jgi:hypothetical protein
MTALISEADYRPVWAYHSIAPNTNRYEFLGALEMLKHDCMNYEIQQIWPR